MWKGPVINDYVDPSPNQILGNKSVFFSLTTMFVYFFFCHSKCFPCRACYGTIGFVAPILVDVDMASENDLFSLTGISTPTNLFNEPVETIELCPLP